jgi:hypothetical protein
MPFSNGLSVRNVQAGSRRRFGFGRRQNKDPFTSQGMEVNKSEGGFKSLTQGGKYLTQAIDFHLDFGITGSNLSEPYRYVVKDSNNIWVPDFAIEDLINSSEEFDVVRGLCSKYRVTGVRLSLDYSRVVPVDTNLDKLILTPETDLIKIEDPLINKASMKLSMDHPGVKNYFFNLNKGNMKEENIDWLESNVSYPGKIRIALSSQGENFIDRNDYYKLGVLKVSVLINYVQLDRKSLTNRLKTLIKDKIQLPGQAMSTASVSNEHFDKVDPNTDDPLDGSGSV